MSDTIVTDEWARWQQGGCLDYAHALIRLNPKLRFGSLAYDGVVIHHFAHDNECAYDSAGKHSMPYKGICGEMDCIADDFADDYDEPYAPDVTDAIVHIRRNRILG